MWAWYYRAQTNQLDFLAYIKHDLHTNQGTSEESETSEDEYLARRIQIHLDDFLLWPFFTCFKKWEVKKWYYKNNPSRSGFSSPRAFQWRSRKCRSPYGFFGNWFFVGSYWTSTPAVHILFRLEHYIWVLNLHHEYVHTCVLFECSLCTSVYARILKLPVFVCGRHRGVDVNTDSLTHETRLCTNSAQNVYVCVVVVHKKLGHDYLLFEIA